MYISRFQLGNYKSFREPDALELTQGFNIISGQNNAGKTALLEAISLNFSANPHRTARTVPARDTIPNQFSWAHMSFTVTPNELLELMRASGAQQFQLAQPDLGSPFAKKIDYVDDSRESAQRLLQGILAEGSVTFELRVVVQPGNPKSWQLPRIPSYGLYPAQQQGANFNYVAFGLDTQMQVTNAGGRLVPNYEDIGLTLTPIFQRHIYRFTAERMNVGAGSHGANTYLAPNATNLPEVLSQLQHNTSRFAALNRTLNAIFPQVRQVSVRGIAPGQVEIVVWPHAPATQRDDLAVPLAESGTGIGQVLAILYVVMTSDRPQVMIIDEPQSFLHPGAARKPIGFLKLNAHHQFVIATHSPTIISAADPKTITRVRYEDAESTLQQIDAKLEKGIQTTLADLGVRLSDSFGADNLWVEGRTEEKCFRLIAEKLLNWPLHGTEILGVRQTGDLEGRDAKRVFEIYQSLSHGASLLPPAIGFILDQECRSEEAKRELSRMGAQFLPRRMFENYLLNPEAIAAVATAIEGFRPRQLTRDEVRDSIELKSDNPNYYCPPKHCPSTNRTHLIDGARVLEEIFREFSEARVTYEKVRHGIALTEWLIEHSSDDLAEIRELLGHVLGVSAAGAPRYSRS